MEDERSRFIKMHRCPACGGTLVFSPEKGRLGCEYCDEEYDVPKDKPDVTQVAPTAQGEQAHQFGNFDFMQFYNSAQIETGENLPVYHCSNCGADVLAAGETAALTCPYCSGKIVLTDKISGNIRPNGIIPFKIPQKDLKKHVDNFYKGKKLIIDVYQQNVK